MNLNKLIKHSETDNETDAYVLYSTEFQMQINT